MELDQRAEVAMQAILDETDHGLEAWPRANHISFGMSLSYAAWAVEEYACAQPLPQLDRLKGEEDRDSVVFMRLLSRDNLAL